MVRRRRRHRALIALTVLFCQPESLKAQELNDFSVPEQVVQVQPILGNGPVVLECMLTKRGSLGCEVDREIKSIECQSRNSSEESTRRLRGKAKGRFLLCDRPADSEKLLSGVWDLYLRGSDGSFSQWAVQAASEEQLKKAYELQGKALELRRSERNFHFFVLPEIRYWYFQSEEAAAEFAVSTRVWLWKNFFGGAEFVQPVLRTKDFARSWQIGIGPRWNFLAERIFWELQLGFSHWGGSGISGLPTTSLGSALYYRVSPRFRVGLRAEKRWPQLEGLKEASQLGFALFWAPLAKIQDPSQPEAYWGLTASADYFSFAWSDSRLPVDRQGLKAGFGVSLTF